MRSKDKYVPAGEKLKDGLIWLSICFVIALAGTGAILLIAAALITLRS